jgi:hypothetical protein
VAKAGETLITETLIEEAGRLAAMCEYTETVAALLGVSKPTLYRWIKRGVREQRRIDKGLAPRANEEPYRAMSNSIKRGRAQAEQRNLSVIDAAAQGGQWQAAAWRLERAHPERWGNVTMRLRELEKRFDELLRQHETNKKGFGRENC